MNTAQLECFVRVAELLSFQQAAKALHVSQPAVSKQIAALEDELGARLLIRTTRSVALTPAGQLFLPDASGMLRMAYHARQTVAEAGRRASDTLRIGYLDPFELELLPPVFSALRKAHPGFSPVLTQMSGGVSQLESGQMDVCFALKDRRKREKIGFLPLSVEPVVCLLSEDHPLSGCDFIAAAQLKGLPRVRVFPYAARGRFSSARKAGASRGAGEEKAVFCDNFAEARCLLLNGMGYCVLPRYLAALCEGLKAIDCDVKWNQTHGVYFREDATPELLGDFLTLLQEACV